MNTGILRGRHPIQLVTPVVLFSAFLLLLLVSLSLPLIKPIYLLQISAKTNDDEPITSIATEIRFGLWGYCASGYSFSRAKPVFDQNYYCSKAKVGYDIDPVILQLIQDNRIETILVGSLTYALIIHPIACGLTLLLIIPPTVRLFRDTMPGFVAICTLLLSILPAIITTVIFVIDIVLVIIAQSRIDAATGGTLVVSWGPAVWMTCAAMICLWLGIIGLSAYACGCCGLSDRRVELKLKKLNEKLKRRSRKDDVQEIP